LSECIPEIERKIAVAEPNFGLINKSGMNDGWLAASLVQQLIIFD